MTTATLAQIVAKAGIQRLSLIGLSKNVGKTTATNHLLEALLQQQLYKAEELALTSLGLDGEAIDALTGLPKPRYVPQSGFLVATAASLLQQAESEGAQFEQLLQLPARTALGSIRLVRILRPGRIIIAGPTLLSELRGLLKQLHIYGARLSIVDGAINRLGAAATNVSHACIICTGTSAGATPQLVARRTVDILARLSVPQSSWADEYKKLHANVRLLLISPKQHDEVTLPFTDQPEPASEAQWIVESLQSIQHAVYLLRGAFTEELSRELLQHLSEQLPAGQQGEIVVGDGTKIFCHSVTLQRLSDRGLHIRVADPIHILALTINPFTPEYTCTPECLVDALIRELPDEHPPIIDVVSGMEAY
jgi:hypothetical protein